MTVSFPFFCFFIGVDSFTILFICKCNLALGELMNYVIVYWSRYGNGKKVVDYLAGRIEKKKGKIQIFKTDEADPTNLPEADVYVFSTPTEAFGVQREMKKFMKNLEGLDQKKYGIVNTHGMKKSVLPKMEKILSKKNMVMVAGVDFEVGAGVKTGDGLKDGWQAEIDAFAKKL